MSVSVPISLPAEFLAELLAPHLVAWKQEYLAAQPAPDPWLTVPEAAAYAKMTERYMAQLVHGKPYRAAANGQPERPAIAPKISAGDTGFARGARVRRSAVDAYLTRYAYKQR